ncbi:MAG: hypothetical protein MI757_14310, partial [Pirellulales bacterium]|nr:hypothetical protein [Pirellulales bacterium]
MDICMKISTIVHSTARSTFARFSVWTIVVAAMIVVEPAAAQQQTDIVKLRAEKLARERRHILNC